MGPPPYGPLSNLDEPQPRWSECAMGDCRTWHSFRTTPTPSRLLERLGVLNLGAGGYRERQGRRVGARCWEREAIMVRRQEVTQQPRVGEAVSYTHLRA